MFWKEIANHKLVVCFTVGEVYDCLHVDKYVAGPGNNAVLVCKSLSFKAVL